MVWQEHWVSGHWPPVRQEQRVPDEQGLLIPQEQDVAIKWVNPVFLNPLAAFCAVADLRYAFPNKLAS